MKLNSFGSKYKLHCKEKPFVKKEIATKVCSNKNCSHKGALQPTSNFYKRFTTKDGLDPECTDCKKVRQKAIQQKSIKQREERFGMFMSYTKGYQLK